MSMHMLTRAKTAVRAPETGEKNIEGWGCEREGRRGGLTDTQEQQPLKGVRHEQTLSTPPNVAHTESYCCPNG